MPGIVDSDEIARIGARTWRIDGSTARLRCPRWDRVFRGTGSLEIDDSGLFLRIYPRNTAGFDVPRHLFSFPPSGEIIADEWYATGMIRDGDGRFWHVGRFRPSLNGGPGGFVIVGRPREVRCRKTLRSSTVGNTGQLYFFPSLGFPPNRHRHYQEHVGASIIRAGSQFDVAEVDAAGMSLRFLNADAGECQIESPCDPLPPLWGLRICEAIQLITARWHEWTIQVTNNGTRQSVTVRGPVAPESTNLRSPLDGATPHFTAKWQMFRDFLEAIWHDESDGLHLLSGALRSVIRASTASIEAEALQLGVSIERVLRKEFSEARARVEIEPDKIRRAIKLIEDSDLDETFKTRIVNAVSAFANPRAQEILAVLARDGRVRPGWERIFGQLRNPAVHGDTASDDIQKWSDLCAAGLTMFFELILARIGYKGPISDYSQRQAPIVAFPPPSLRPEPE